MTQRIITIGDIHGCAIALRSLLQAIQPGSNDIVITLGDYVDRGLDSKGVLDQLVELRSTCNLIPLLGNHDVQMLAAVDSDNEFRRWLDFGGVATLQSYGDSLNFISVDVEHLEFLRSCLRYHETADHFFVHANYREGQPLSEQEDEVLLWRSLRDRVPKKHCSGKIAIVGHTPQKDGTILDLGHLVCLDTGCCYGGLLTAMNLATGQTWQSKEDGTLV